MRENTKQQIRLWAMCCHLSALLWIPLAGLVFLGIPIYLPFLNILGPLAIWRWKGKQDPWIDFQGRESLNFQLSLTVYALIIIITSLFFLCIIGLVAMISNLSSHQLGTIFNSLIMFLSLMILVMMLLQLISVNLAAVKAYNGQYYRYPFTIRFMK